MRIFRAMEGPHPQILIYLPSELSVPEILPRERDVRLVCFNDEGEAVVRAGHEWPETPVFRHHPPIPHLHQPIATLALLESLDRCRMTGTRTPLEAVLEPGVRTNHPPALLVNPAAQGVDS